MLKKIVPSSLFCGFALILAGCSTATKSAKVPDYMLDSSYYNEIAKFDYSDSINDLLASISRYEGSSAGGDCSGLVSLINSKNDDIYFDPSNLHKYMISHRKSEGIYNLYAKNGNIIYKNPKPGDLIFFHNTTSSTKNSKKKHITHIGVIKEVYKDGRVSFVHNTRGKNKVAYMNILEKNTHKKGSQTQNSYIISCKRGDYSCLTSNRFAGFGTVMAR